QRLAVLGARFPRLRARRDETLRDHVHRPVQVELLPSGRVGAAVFDAMLAKRVVDVALRGCALGAQAPARDGAVGVTLDLNDLLTRDVDALAAAHGAVGAHRLHDAIGRLGPRLDPLRAARARGASEAERVPL